MNIINSVKRLTIFERLLWGVSAAVVFLSYMLSGQGGVLAVTASLIGITALIFVAKGDVFGQALMVIFSLLYAVISMQYRYYGEMITYLGMSAPAAVMSVITWLKHPYKEDHSEVKVSGLNKKSAAVMIVLTVSVTIAFYFILGAFGTNNLYISTLSVATSFIASFMLILRVPFYAIAYSFNDVVLIALWVLASKENPSYIPMIFCFVMFLCNDMYGFYNWSRMKKRQNG